MAVKRLHLKCEVCNKTTLLKIQVGYIENHPIRINCGNCGILIKGFVLINQENFKIDLKFENSKLINPQSNIDYFVESSTELLTNKLKTFENGIEILMPTPFIRAIMKMASEEYNEFRARILKSVAFIKNEWIFVRRINELYLNSQNKYLVKEVKRYLQEEQFPMNNVLEHTRGVHQVNLMLYQLISPDRFENATKLFFNEIEKIVKVEPSHLFEMARYFGEAKIQEYEVKVFNITEEIINKFNNFIPVIGVEYYNTPIGELLHDKGITTVSFEDIKQLYVDLYELGTDMISILLGFNNIIHRNNFIKMKNKRKDVQTLDDFFNKPKAARIEFIDGNEYFDNLVKGVFNSKIRNAIGHYDYDHFQQKLKFYPKGKENTENIEEKYLVEFCLQTWNAFLTILDLSELLYQVKKIYLTDLGHKIQVTPDVFYKG